MRIVREQITELSVHDVRVTPRLVAETFQDGQTPAQEVEAAVSPGMRRKTIGRSAVAAIGLSVVGISGLFVSCAPEDGESPIQQGFWQSKAPQEISAITADEVSEWGGDFLGEESIEVRPPEFDRNKFKAGDFIGALVIEYADYDREAKLSATDIQNCEAGKALSEDKMGACFWLLRDAYFENLGQISPKAHPKSVHTFTAGADIGNLYLDNGPVLTESYEGMPTLVAWHNITTIHKQAILNGNTYNQPQMGINDFIAKDSIIKFIEPTDTKGYVLEHTYKRNEFFIVDYRANPTAAAEKIVGMNHCDVVGYQCWEPGSADNRLGYCLEAVSSRIVPGSVAQVGETIIGDGHLG